MRIKPLAPAILRQIDFSYSLNEEAQQRRPPVRQDTPKNSDEAAVCCSAWFGGGRHGWRRTLLHRLAAVDDHGVADHEGGGV